MAAPNIPNLLSLGRGTRGGRGRGRGRGHGGAHAAGPGPYPDATIQGTDSDAALSRLSAVQLGYLDDPFAALLSPADGGPPPRRLPIINRGTYTRTMGLDKLIYAFLSEPEGPGSSGPDPRRQVISFGAGTDTRALRVFSRPGRQDGLIYHEIDFPAICTRKLQLVRANPLLTRVLPPPSAHHEVSSWQSQALGGGEFWCHGLDLRRLAHTGGEGDEPAHTDGGDTLAPVLLPGIRTDVPTLLVSECCLCYLETPDARAVVSWFASRIPSVGMVLYEPVRPDDAFGRQMVANLSARRIRMPTLEIYAEPADQERRLREAGFADGARALAMREVWDRWVPAEEKERVDALEGLDEVEEWNMLADHYIIAWGWRGPGFEGWREL